MLTTIDNPWNPFKNWDEWLAYDESHGYCCNEYLARKAIISDSLSEDENNEIIRTAMKEIVANDPIGIYRMIGEDETPVAVAIDTLGGS